MSPCHVDDFEKGQRASHFTFWQEINQDMIGIRCPRFGNSTVIVLDLVNLVRDCRCLHTIFKGDLIGFSALNEDRDDGCCLIHAINATNRSSLSDRCFKDYRLHYKYTDHSNRRVTFAIYESYRAICRVFPVQRYSSYRVLVSPIFAAIASPEYCTRWCMSEKEPLEDIVRWFQRGGLESTMTRPPRVVKLGAPQVRQMPRMRSQA